MKKKDGMVLREVCGEKVLVVRMSPGRREEVASMSKTVSPFLVADGIVLCVAAVPTAVTVTTS